MYKQGPISSSGSIINLSISIVNIVSSIGSLNVASANFSIFNQTIKGSFRSGLLFGRGSITGLYADWNARAQISLRKGTFKVGVAGNLSLLNASGQIGFVTDDLNISLKAVGLLIKLVRNSL